MASPLGLTIKTDINTMQIGDCIPCRYTALTSGVAGYFSELGTCTVSEIPLTGTATPDGLFYLIKVAKGTLIADRPIQTNISWDTLNTAKFIEGKISKYILPTSVITNNTLGNTNYNIKDLFILNAPTPMGGQLGIYNTGVFSSRLYIEFKYNINVAISGIGIWATSNSAGYEPMKGFTLTYSANGLFTDEIIICTNTYSTPGSLQTFMLSNKIIASNFRFYVDSWYVFNGGDGQNVGGIIPLIDGQKDIILRSLSGGCAYADANGNSSTTDKSLGLTFPSTTEYDKYIRLSDLGGKITKEDDNVWHWSNLYNWCKDTPITSIGANTNRVYRGKSTTTNFLNAVSSTVNATVGFRPVLNFVEANIASEVIF